jgi:hypothetical protein
MSAQIEKVSATEPLMSLKNIERVWFRIGKGLESSIEQSVDFSL